MNSHTALLIGVYIVLPFLTESGTLIASLHIEESGP